MPNTLSKTRRQRFDVYFGFSDQAVIAEQLDQLVARTGLKRSDHLRQALRLYLQQIPTNTHSDSHEPSRTP